MKLILLSGGMDSTTLLHRYPDSIALTYRYGQINEAAELMASRDICKELNVKHIIHDLSSFGELVSNQTSIIKDQNHVETKYDYEIPYKNLVFISHALAVAKVNNCDEISLGVLGTDQLDDCSSEFLESMNRISGGIKITFPFHQLAKHQIRRHGFELGVDYSKTVSCYYQTDLLGEPCNECSACINRNSAI
ncbi:hypothetical protein NVP1081O_255 [Vibrio phage 1.081.O._10N.286.52.C2]|nr:hypothetical protein NVP1081O_255 [Vibrio phage 1.081.O._10N.286.52.C2]